MSEPRVVDPVPITLGDRVRHLLFTRAAVRQSEIELSRAWGQERTFFSAILRLAQHLAQGDVAALSITDIGILAWQGLLHEDPSLSYAEVEATLPYMTPGDLVPYAIAIMQAWQAASPPPPPAASQGEVVPDTNPLDASIGVPSGPMTALSSA